MAWNYYFKDRAGEQNGPVSFEELLIVARSGRLAPDCLVWAEGGEPRAARDIPELAEALGASTARNGGSHLPAAGERMRSDFPVWDLFWRSIAMTFGMLLVIPAPWAGPWFYRWLAGRLSLPNGRRLLLESPFNASAALFLVFALSIVAPAAYTGLIAAYDPAAAADAAGPALARLLGSAIEFVCTFLIMRWFVGSLRSDDGALAIRFEGDFWPYLGWNLLIGLSMITLIGWAWVLRFLLRWICRNIAGTHRFDFVGEGSSLLWRLIVLFIGCLFIIPIPWLFAWFYNWLVTQFVVAPAVQAQALEQTIAA
jgi:hypothetical protein